MVDAVFNHSGRKFEPWIDILEHGKESRYADWFMVEDWVQVQKRGDTRADPGNPAWKSRT